VTAVCSSPDLDQWLAILAVELVPLVTAPGDTLLSGALGTSLDSALTLAAGAVALWGACCSTAHQAGLTWGLPGVDTMRDLLHGLCTWSAAKPAAWAEWQLDAVLASFLVLWRHTRTPGLRPADLPHCLPWLAGQVVPAPHSAAGDTPTDSQPPPCLTQGQPVEDPPSSLLPGAPGLLQGADGVVPAAAETAVAAEQGAGLTDVQLLTAVLVRQQVRGWCQG
jgi:hypothetical protein